MEQFQSTSGEGWMLPIDVDMPVRALESPCVISPSQPTAPSSSPKANVGEFAAARHALGELTVVQIHDEPSVLFEPSLEAIGWIEQQLADWLPVVYVDSGSVIGEWRPWAMDDLRTLREPEPARRRRPRRHRSDP